MQRPPSSFVSETRLWDSLMAMAQFGATPQGGVNRPALSEVDTQAQLALAAQARAAGLQVSRDAIGNLFLRLAGQEAELPPVLSGSHLDSQPTGGKFDGVYGVMAAVEALLAIASSGQTPRRSIEAVAWMNEEGSRFAPGMMGSAVFAGQREVSDVLAVSDAQGVSVAHALVVQQQRLSAIPLRPLGGPVHAYVEAHIEQGPVLEREGFPVGIVSGIQGKHTWRIEVQGEAAHAGTSQRRERKDALLAAVAMVQALTAHMHDAEDITKFTVGRFEVSPNAPSVVPERVVFSIDLRHPDSDTLRQLSAAVPDLCAAHRGPCQVHPVLLSQADSLTFSAALRAQSRRIAEQLGVACRDIASSAGHDARYLHAVAPSAMLFVPCHLGITHNEAESATPADLAAGTRVLADFLLELAS